MASFFVLFISISSFASASVNVNELALSSTWRALTHTDENMSAIQDERFLLSMPSFSLQQELKLTIKELQTNQQALCQYPARAFWLASKNLITSPDFSHCKELTEFLTKVPIDNLSLVFSAENLTQPSSMMGHILLKTEGTLDNGEKVEYGVTYFTKIDAVNLPKTIYQTMISGSPGFFSLSPYDEHLFRYLIKEQRNVWEYQLNISNFHKYLTQLHLWELKNKNIEYFFVEYNCATLIHFVLAISSPELLKDQSLWLTPLDVVKTVNNINLVKNTIVIPSSDWQVRMLSESIKSTTPNKLIKQFNEAGTLPNANTSDSEQFLQLELLSSYYDFEKENKRINDADYSDKISKINALKKEVSQFSIDLSNYKLPTKTPNDSKLSLQYINNENNALRLRFTPASHHLSDDNRQYFAESELTLGEITLSYDDKNKLKLHNFHLYSMTNLTPYHSITGGVSSGFNISYTQQNSDLVNTKGFTEVGMKLGLTKQLNTDMYIYALGELTLATNFKYTFLTGEPKLGMIIYEIFNMKSVIEISRVYNSANSGFNYTKLNWQQSLFINKDWKIEFNLLRNQSNHEFNNEVGISLERHF